MAEENKQLAQMMDQRGGLDPFDAPIPGSSLTQNPDEKMPYEQAPKHVDQEDAMHDIFMNLTDDEKLDDILDIMRSGVPVEDVAQTILFAGFQSGQYTPDLMLTLIEPTIYMLMSIAEVHGIEAEIYPEENFPESEEDEKMQNEKAMMSFRELFKRGGVGEEASENYERAEREEPVTTMIADKVERRPATGAQSSPSMMEAILGSPASIEGE